VFQKLRRALWAVRIRVLFVAIVLSVAACAGDKAGSAANGSGLYNPDALPTGPVGRAIRNGYAILTNTPAEARGLVRADMSCAACHIAGGTVPRGGSLAGALASFPQWNERAKRVITLEDRIAECFLYSMNGRPPKYASKPMVSLVAYIAWLSRGRPILSASGSQSSFTVALPSARPDVARGKVIYRQKCAECHQTSGAGISGTFPPLWGPTSFNDAAGMTHLNVITGWVKFNMPKGAAGSLSLKEAYDVSAYVLSHDRPHFKRNALVTTESLPASYY
jgi:thiosulfate dehydrogenase